MVYEPVLMLPNPSIITQDGGIAGYEERGIGTVHAAKRVFP